MSATAITTTPRGEPGLKTGLGGPVRVLSRGAGLKASVRLVTNGKQKAVIKDYSATPWYLKPLARYLVQREISVLRALAPYSFAPNYIESIDAHRFVIEYVDGVHPSVESRSSAGHVYRSAQQALAALHHTGYAHNDLHSRNMLIHPHRGVIFIDFVAAVRFAPGDRESRFSPFRWLKRCMQHADRYNLVKRKRHFTSEPHDQAEAALLSGGRAFASLTRWWKRLIRVRRQRRFRLHPRGCGCR